MEDDEPKRFLFKPNDAFKSKWDILIMIFAVINCFTIPLKVAFKPDFMDNRYFSISNNVIDFFFFLDIIVSFRTVLIDEKGEEITDLGVICKSYITGMFLIDLCATIPFD